MKVGVDGILLGAWATIDDTDRILDIGTGTGLIALMLAQRAPNAQITAIEIDPDACQQAQENIARSPWSERIQVEHISFQDYLQHQIFDLIVSNPPFFSPSRPNSPRAIARQTITLSPQDIVQTVKPHLSHRGRLALVLPYEQVPEMTDIAIAHHLYPRRQTHIRPTSSSKLKRSLVEFSPYQISFDPQELTLERSRHTYSPEYEQLISDFFLKYKQ